MNCLCAPTMQYCLFVYRLMFGFAADLVVIETCGMCSRVWLENVTDRSALENIKVKQDEFFPPFQHHDKPFGYIILSVGTSNIEEPHKLNSVFNVFKLYVDIMPQILFNHCNKFMIPILFSGLQRCKGSCACYEYRQDKIRLALFWRVCKLAKRLTIQACQGIDPDFFRFAIYNYKYREDYLAHLHLKDPKNDRRNDEHYP